MEQLIYKIYVSVYNALSSMQVDSANQYKE